MINKSGKTKYFNCVMSAIIFVASFLFASLTFSIPKNLAYGWTSSTQEAELAIPGSANSKDNPYLIYNGGQLVWFMHNKTSNSYAKLMTNIDLSAKNYNVDKTYSKTVVLDGNNCSIVGLKNEALFRNVQGTSSSAATVTVKNLIINCNISHAGDAAAVVRKVSSYGNVTMENVTVLGSVKGTGSSDAVGAFVGWASSAGSITLTNCINYATITGAFSGGIGGLLGATSLSLTKCANFGSVTGSSHTGGLVGKTEVAATFTKCFNNASVTATGTNGLGGLVGTTANNLTFTACYNSGNISSSAKARAGGFVGDGSSKTLTLKNCYNSGTISTKFSYHNYSSETKNEVFAGDGLSYLVGEKFETAKQTESNNASIGDRTSVQLKSNNKGLEVTSFSGGGDDSDDGGNTSYSSEYNLSVGTITTLNSISQPTFCSNATLSCSASKGINCAGQSNDDVVLEFEVNYVAEGTIRTSSGSGPSVGKAKVYRNGKIKVSDYNNHARWYHSSWETESGTYKKHTRDSKPAFMIGSTYFSVPMFDSDDIWDPYCQEFEDYAKLSQVSNEWQSYFDGAYIEKSGSNIKIYPMMMCWYGQINIWSHQDSFAFDKVSYSLSIPSGAADTSNTASTINVSDIGSSYYVTDANINGGKPILKDFYWAYA